MKRRTFIKNSALASTLLYVPSFIKAFGNVEANSIQTQKRLVVIHLRGGNDGLNTVVPFRNDIYYKARPKIAINKQNLINLNNDVGLHSSLQPLKQLYDKGYLSIINNVGYPNPNRSHFRSSEIWETAVSNAYANSGWIGRYLDSYGKRAYNAIEIDETLSLALKGKHQNGIATKNGAQLYKSLHESYFNNILAYQPNNTHLSEHNLGYLYNTMIDAKSSAKYIYEKTKTVNLSQNYPSQNPLANQLKVAAQFINSNLDTRIIYTALTGFDTHSGQLNRQSHLLNLYAESVLAFVNDLKRNGTFKNTLILTFSEFGRRVKQNLSNGTDHGTANNVFVIGKNLKQQGLYNDLANLTNLDKNGDIKYEIDFRRIYATILNKWLHVDNSRVLDKSYSTLQFI